MNQLSEMAKFVTSFTNANLYDVNRVADEATSESAPRDEGQDLPVYYILSASSLTFPLLNLLPIFYPKFPRPGLANCGYPFAWRETQ